MTISLRTALKITIQSVGHVLSEVVNLAHTSVPEGEIMTLTTQWHNHCLSTYMYFVSVWLTIFSYMVFSTLTSFLLKIHTEFQELISWCEHYERQLRPRDILMHPWLRKHSVSDTEEGKTAQAKSRGQWHKQWFRDKLGAETNKRSSQWKLGEKSTQNVKTDRAWQRRMRI